MLSNVVSSSGVNSDSVLSHSLTFSTGNGSPCSSVIPKASFNVTLAFLSGLP